MAGPMFEPNCTLNHAVQDRIRGFVMQDLLHRTHHHRQYEPPGHHPHCTGGGGEGEGDGGGEVMAETDWLRSVLVTPLTVT